MTRTEHDRSIPVKVTVGATTIPATLNTTVTAQRFAAALPFTVAVRRFADDYCGPVPALDFDPGELKAGWRDGDIGYGGGYFSILFQGQEHSHDYTDMMIIGRIDDGHLDTVRRLPDAITVTVDHTV